MYTQFVNIPFFQDLFRGPFWHQAIFGNTISEYVFAFVAFLILLAIFKAIQFILVKYLVVLARRTHFDLDDTIIEIVQSFRASLYIYFAFYVAVRMSLVVSATTKEALNAFLIFFIIHEIVESAHILVKYVVRKYLMENGDLGVESMSQMLSILTRIVLWAIGALIILSNFGFDITAILAGLGVAGLAIGLALQPVFADLFAAFSIYFDKPFRVGDFVVIGEQSGSIERIGVKTTRIRALDGEEIIMSNSELSSAIIHNYAQMSRRRIVFHFGITRESGMDKLQEIPQLVERIIKKNKNVTFDRTHFKEFDATALTYEAVYYVESSDYTEFMDIQQDINFEICEIFRKKEIEMAYPTQTIYQYSMDTKLK